MIRKSAILLCLLSPLAVLSQSDQKTIDNMDGTFSFAKYQGALSVHYSHLWKLGKAQKLSIGLGARVTSYLGAIQYYITAPAGLTSESTSPLIFFKENIGANIDTFLVKSPQVTMLNLSINIHYRLSTKLTAGFNIDAVGFSFGSATQGNYINGYMVKTVSASATRFNALLISDNDRGSLNSELFAKYKLTEKWSIRGAIQFLFTECTTETKVQQFPERMIASEISHCCLPFAPAIKSTNYENNLFIYPCRVDDCLSTRKHNTYHTG